MEIRGSIGELKQPFKVHSKLFQKLEKEALYKTFYEATYCATDARYKYYKLKSNCSSEQTPRLRN